MRVTVIEDDESVRSAIVYLLKREGYEVESTGDGERALEVVDARPPDVIVLDVMLPGVDGFEVCRLIRRSSSVPILMLTARDEEIDRVVGLEIGADDYLTKPFSTRELIARVKALLRRRSLLHEDLARDGEGTPAVLDINGVRLDPATRQVDVNERGVRLKPKEFDLLAFLMRHAGQVFSAERLIESVWGYAYPGDTRTVPVHVRGLRRRIEDDASNPQRIETVRGVGYRFVP